VFACIPTVTWFPLHKPPAAPSACVLPGCARAELGTPTAATYISGNRPHGAGPHSERGAKGHRTPHIPSNQRKSASFSLQGTHFPCRASSQFAVGWARTVAETSRWRRLHSIARRSATPDLGVCLSRLGQAGPWETPAPTFAAPRSGSQPPDFLNSEPAVPRGSSAVIEPAPTPLSTGNFPQGTDKPKVFQENVLGIYCGSFTFMFRRIFARGKTSLLLRLFDSFEDTTPWGAWCDTPSTSSVTPLENASVRLSVFGGSRRLTLSPAGTW
jgi:hypothetical protein